MIRKEMARDFHDEMGNHLASIISMVNVLSLHLDNQDEKTSSTLKKIESSSKALYDGTREFMWTMEPNHDKLSEILLFLRDFGVNLYRNTSIDFSLTNNLDNSELDIHFAAGTSRHIISIFKETMTNTLKHSDANSGVLSCTILEEEELGILSFRDNGSGKISGSGRGINNMINRASKINSELLLINEGEGCEVQLRIPTHLKG